MALGTAARSTATAVSLFSVHTQMKLARFIQYRADLAIGVFVTLGLAMVTPLFQLLIYTRTRGFPDWSIHQLLVFQGVLLLSAGIRELLFGDVRGEMKRLVAKGEFDRLLLKPDSPLLQLLTLGFSPHALGTVVVGAGLLGWACWHLGAPLSPVRVVAFLVLMLAGVLVSLSATLLYCILTLRWTYPIRLDESFDKVLRFGDFPLGVYPTVFRAVFLTLVPLSVVANWPAQALLGRLDLGAVVALAGAVAVWLFMVRWWNRQLRQYTSAGG